MLTPAATYVRASTEYQIYSTQNQADALNEYAAGHNYSIVATYEDNGFSGLDLKGRAGLRKLLQDTISPHCPFRALLVYDISRWGRFQDPDEAAYYEFLCRRAGVEVVYCVEPLLPLEAPTFVAVVKSIKRAMAAEYSRELSEKTYAAQRDTVLQGYCPSGGANLGLRRMLLDGMGRPKAILEIGDHKRIQSDRVVLCPGPAEEVEIVNRMFRLCAEEGLHPPQIARRLNLEGLTAPTGGRWAPSTIHAILRNEKYVGTYVYGRRQGRLKQRPVPVPRSEWVRAPGAFKAIVPQDIFDQAQVRLDTRTRKRSDAQLLAALAELLHRDGYLSAVQISTNSTTPSPDLYAARFGSLREAYRLVGYPFRYRPGTRMGFGSEELLEKLKTLLSRQGYLSARLLAATPGMPQVGVYRRRFGSITKAYARIGYEPADGQSRSGNGL